MHWHCLHIWSSFTSDPGPLKYQKLLTPVETPRVVGSLLYLFFVPLPPSLPQPCPAFLSLPRSSACAFLLKNRCLLDLDSHHITSKAPNSKSLFSLLQESLFSSCTHHSPQAFGHVPFLCGPIAYPRLPDCRDPSSQPTESPSPRADYLASPPRFFVCIMAPFPILHAHSSSISTSCYRSRHSDHSRQHFLPLRRAPC